jgi:hypothetical protein
VAVQPSGLSDTKKPPKGGFFVREAITAWQERQRQQQERLEQRQERQQRQQQERLEQQQEQRLQ